jgi:hypothetical protein
MVYALQKCKHYLLANMFTFYANHMALMYLVNKPQVFGKFVNWLLLFMEYDFKIVYKLGRSHLMADAWNGILIKLKLLEYLIKPTMLTFSLWFGYSLICHS